MRDTIRGFGARRAPKLGGAFAAVLVLCGPAFGQATPPVPAPAITAVHPGDKGAAVVWTAPAGVTGIAGYDLRVILTSADETVDANWRVLKDVWSGGRLSFEVTGLDNSSSYDFEVRAVTDEDGAWSSTVSATPADPGSCSAAPLDLPLGVPLPADLSASGSDADYFRFTLTRTTPVALFTTGEMDTSAALTGPNGAVAQNNDGFVEGGPRNFLIGRTLEAGTYCLQVFAFRGLAKGPYTVRFETVPDTTGAGNAKQVEVDGFGIGLLDSGDSDWFTFTLDSETDVVLRTGGLVFYTAATLLDGGETPLETNAAGFLPDDGDLGFVDEVYGGSRRFLIRRKLAAGVYYVKVFVPASGVTGAYSFHVGTVTEPGSDVAGAQSLEFGALGAGRIDPSTDADYFRIDMAEQGHVFLRAVSNSVALGGAVVDSNGAAVAANVFAEEFKLNGPKGFTVSARLPKGASYLKVTRSGGADTGGYALRAFRDDYMDETVDACSTLTSPWTDPLSGCQWHLRNRGQRRGTSGEDIRVEDVWKGGNMGAGIPVAVVDLGVHGGHPDLVDNFDEAKSHDYGTGRLFGPFENHGTEVAGIIAARDNGLGGRGVAPRATIYGYRLLAWLNEANAADAMTRNSATMAVSSNSWNSGDGPGLDSVSSAWERAIDTGVASGYGGKGVVYVWSAGNGATQDDDANFDGYTNYYGVVVACAVNDRGRRVSYSELGASLWVCAPSRDDARRRPGLLTTNNYGRYRDGFGGTSAATPVVSGVVALIRAANADLTWRDVKLILAGSARKNDASNRGWRTGAAKYGASGSYNFNHEYGFGVVDAKAAVDLADGWKNLPALIETAPVKAAPGLSVPDAPRPFRPISPVPGTTVASAVTVGDEVEFIEFVEVIADFTAPSFRDLRVELVSPSNTVSRLAFPTIRRRPLGIDADYRFGSAAHLGESPAGTWTLRVTDEAAGFTATLDSWSVKVYGHRSTPLTTPGAPAVRAAASAQRVLTLSWSAPASTGDSAIAGYDARYIPSDATNKSNSQWTVLPGVWTSGALEYELTGLRDGTRYDVAVRAVNAGGAGAWSRPAVAETLPNQSPRPVGSLTGPTLRVGDGNATVDAAAAFEDPEGDALTYAASSSAPAVAGVSVSGARVTLTPLVRGMATITVTATDVGGSDASAEQTFGVRVRGRRGVTISRDALTVGEGASGSYTVALNSEPSGEVTVTPAVPANRNISVSPSRLAFSASDWRTARTVTVEAATDANTVSEPAVTIGHAVSGADYGSVTAPSVRVTIVEKDASVLSVESARASEGEGAVSFEVSLSKANTSEIEVDYATSDGTARAGSDYTASSGTLTFPAGSTASRWIAVTIADDAVDEGEEETFRLTLGNARHASLAGGGSALEVLGTIEDDDDSPDGGGPGGGGGGGPPRAAIATDAACEGTFCRALTGVPVSFRDASAGAARSRLWEFGDGRRSRSASLSHAWSSPGFYEASLAVSDGTVESTASLTFLVEASEPAGTCAADEATRCLGDSRYAVSVEWRTSDGASGPARVVRSGTNESGLFSFFDGANWEALVKVVDGCAVNGYRWVFAASTTDLGFTIRVVDTATGAAREYRNEPGTPAPAITDATAFAEGCGPRVLE